MRRGLGLILLVALGACGPQFAVVPRGGAPYAQAGSPMGLTMTALAQQWAGDPQDLADYLTPIAVELVNQGSAEVRISYADFALTDERGTRYQAINPYSAAVSQRDTPHNLQLTDTRLDVKALMQNGQLLASRVGSVAPPSGGRSGGGSFGGGGRGWSTPPSVRGGGGGYFGGGYHGGYRGGWRGGWGWGPRRWVGYRVGPCMGGYWGGRFSYWDPGCTWYGPGYGLWVGAWGTSYYPAGPTRDVLENGIPEGVLPPGGRVSGFLYFRKATERTSTLTLTWQMHTAREGTDLGSTNVALEVRPAN